VGSAAFDANRSGSNALGFIDVAEYHREDFKWWDVRIDMVTAIHSKLIMFCQCWIQLNDLFGFDGEGLKLRGK